MFALIKKVFIMLTNFNGSLAHVAKVFDIKGISLNNVSCLATPSLINLNSHGLHYYLSMVSLDSCNGICNTLDNLPRRICIPNKIKDAKLNIFNMMKRINESETLTKHISCVGKCKFDCRKCNSNQK